MFLSAPSSTIEHMFAQLKAAVAVVRRAVVELDSKHLSATDAATLVELFSELERLASAGRTLAGRRVEKSYLWREEGFRSPSEWMAAKAQTTRAAAIATIETGRRLEELPETRDQLKAGRLSAVQAAEITAAASADPRAEKALLDTARAESVLALQTRCREVVAAASKDLDRDERLHRARYLRYWTDRDGAVRVDARFAPDAGAKLVASVDAAAFRLHATARKADSTERLEAYRADALVGLADEVTPGPRAVVHVHVDHQAWTRGHTVAGERCQIPGIGPIPVPAAKRLAADGIVRAVLREDADVRSIVNLGRPIPARLVAALEARDQTCAVPGCDRRHDLQNHHTKPYAKTKHARLSELARVCAPHHDLITHHGWVLEGEPGNWQFHKPKRAATRPARE